MRISKDTKQHLHYTLAAAEAGQTEDWKDLRMEAVSLLRRDNWFPSVVDRIVSTQDVDVFARNLRVLISGYDPAGLRRSDEALARLRA